VLYLTLPELIYVAERTLDGPVEIRDQGLLAAAVARPQSSAFGEDTYPTLSTKAAALLHSIAKNHALVDGNKRLALAGTIAFLGINGVRLTFTNDEAYDFVMAVADGTLTEVADIAERSEQRSAPW
jgi:death on curing protein